MKKLPIRILPLAALAASLSVPHPGCPSLLRAQPAPAATPPPPPAAAAVPVHLAPLRVTADLWETPLERMAASVSVWDEPALRAGQVTHFGDLVDRIPNLTWSGGTSRPRYFQIRGIGENSQYEGETPDSTVRFLVDDLDFTGLGMVGSTFDVRQVEVLRGPQAGAFGVNAAGGIVRLVTNAPTPFWTGQVEGTVGGDALRSGGLAVGGPLLPAQPQRLMARIAVQQVSSDGFRRNLTLDRDTNARDEFSARLRLTWNPTAAWNWEGAVLFADARNGYDEFATDNNGRFTYSDQPGRDEQRSRAASLRGTAAGLPGVRLTTVTSGSRVDSIYSYDDDWTDASYQGFSDLRRRRNVVSQELRADSEREEGGPGALARWTLGLHGARTHETSAYTNTDPGNRRGLRTNYVARHYTAFGQIAHDFTDRSRLVLGLRAEHMALAGDGTRTRFRAASGTFDPEVTFRPRFDDTLVGGRLAFEHTLGGRHLLFASVTRGYKGGGINIDARINPPSDPLTYATEYLWNYEVGLRGNALEERLSGEVTAFFLQRRDAQVRDSAGFGGNYRFFTGNGGRAWVHGLEASAALRLRRGWSVHGSLAFMDSWLDDFELANGNPGGGRRLANTPPHGHTLGLRYDAGPGWFGQLEWAGRARQFDSNNHDEARRAFDVVNGSVGYAWRQWTFTVWGRNLFDERYDKRVFFFGNEEPDYETKRYETRADPRQVGASVAYRF